MARAIGDLVAEAGAVDPEEEIELPRPVPIYMTYLTVEPSGNGIVFRPDPYGFDALAMPQMFAHELRDPASSRSG